MFLISALAHTGSPNGIFQLPGPAKASEELVCFYTNKYVYTYSIFVLIASHAWRPRFWTAPSPPPTFDMFLHH